MIVGGDATHTELPDHKTNPRIAELLAIVDQCQDPNILTECLAVAIAENSSALILRTFGRISKIVSGVLAARPSVINKVLGKLFPKLSVIAVAMKQFESIVAVQSCILDLLLSLLTSAFTSGIAEAFAACGILDGTISVLLIHSDMTDLCTKALQLCLSMVDKKTDQLTVLGTKEFGDAIAAVLKAHGDDGSILREIAQLILALCTRFPPVLETLGDTDIVGALVECLSLWQHETTMCRTLLEVVMRLCPIHHDRNRRRFGTAKFFEALVNALMWNRSSGDIFQELCEAIIQICGKNEDIKANIPSALLAKVVNDVLHDSNVPEIIWQSAVTLVYFTAGNESHRHEMCESGMDNILVELETKTNPSLARAIVSCRQRLNGTSLSRNSWFYSDNSADADSESRQKDYNQKIVGNSISIAEEPTFSLADSRQEFTEDDSQSPTNEIRSGSNKVRNGVMKLMGDKKKNVDTLGMVSLMHGMDKISDPAVMVEVYKTCVQMDYRDMCLKALQRTDDVIKEARAAKTYSPLVTFVITDPTHFLAMLRHFLQDLELQTAGLLTVTRMSYAGGGIESFGSSECFQHYYDIMNTHGTNRNITLLALALISRLTSKNQENKLQASRNGGFRVVVTCMRQFPNDAIVLEKFCRYICACVDNAPANAEAFREAGGCEHLLTLVLSQFESGGDIAEALNVTILNVCKRSTANQLFFTSQGCMKLYFKEMATAISVGSVVKFKFPSMLLFGMLQFPDVFLPSLLKCKAPEKIMAILRATAVKDILVLVLFLIQALCDFEPLKSKFADLGIVNALTKLTEGGRNFDMQKHCVAIISSVNNASGVMHSPEPIEYNSQSRKV